MGSLAVRLKLRSNTVNPDAKTLDGKAENADGGTANPFRSESPKLLGNILTGMSLKTDDIELINQKEECLIRDFYDSRRKMRSCTKIIGKELFIVARFKCTFIILTSNNNCLI